MASKYDDMSLEELQAAASEKGIEGRSSMNKEQLQDALKGGRSSSSSASADTPKNPAVDNIQEGSDEVKAEAERRVAVGQPVSDVNTLSSEVGHGAAAEQAAARGGVSVDAETGRIVTPDEAETIVKEREERIQKGEL